MGGGGVQRCGVGVCVLGGRVYAVGGEGVDGSYLPSVKRYVEGEYKWEVVASMGSRRCWVGVAAVNAPSTLVSSSSSSL